MIANPCDFADANTDILQMSGRSFGFNSSLLELSASGPAIACTKQCRLLNVIALQASLRRLFARSVDDVRAMIAGSGGPRSNGVTQAATVRLHDDKSTYTGAQGLPCSAYVRHFGNAVIADIVMAKQPAAPLSSAGYAARCSMKHFALQLCLLLG